MSVCILPFTEQQSFTEPRGQHGQRQKSQSRPGLKFRLRWNMGEDEEASKIQLQNTSQLWNEISFLTAENWWCDSTYITRTPLRNAPHDHKDHRWRVRARPPHVWERCQWRGRCNLWNLLPYPTLQHCWSLQQILRLMGIYDTVEDISEGQDWIKEYLLGSYWISPGRGLQLKRRGNFKAR